MEHFTCALHKCLRETLVQTQGHTAMQIYLHYIQIIAGFCPTTSERGQSNFLSAYKPQCRHTHSSGFVLAVFGTGWCFQAPIQAVKGSSWKYCSDLFRVLPQLNWFHKTCGFSFWAVNWGKLPARQNYRIMKRLKYSLYNYL